MPILRCLPDLAWVPEMCARTVVALALLGLPLPAAETSSSAPTPTPTLPPAVADGSAEPAVGAFSSTVTPLQAGLGEHAGSGAQAPLCWSGGANSWSRQARLEADQPAPDSPQARQAAACLALIEHARTLTAERRYAEAEASFASAITSVDALGQQGIAVTEQAAYIRQAYARCLSYDVATRLAQRWPDAGDESLALARLALHYLPDDPAIQQALDAATTASWAKHGRTLSQVAATTAQRIAQLASTARAEREQSARLAAAGDADQARQQADLAATAMQACRAGSLELLSADEQARSQYQHAHLTATAALARAQQAESRAAPLSILGVGDCTRMVAELAASLAAADAGVAHDLLLLGRSDDALPLAREAAALVPGERAYQDLCQRLQSHADPASGR